MENTSRRELVQIGTLAGATLALGAFTKTGFAQTSPAPTNSVALNSSAPSDAEMLRLGLRVERLLAAYYAQALSAHQTRAYLAPASIEAVQAMAATQNAHVAQLEGAIGTANVPALPTFRFPFPTSVSPIAFPWLGHTLEEIAIGAHLSLIPELGTNELQNTAATFVAAHSRHAALLRTLAGFDPAPRYFESPIALSDVERLIANYGA